MNKHFLTGALATIAFPTIAAAAPAAPMAPMTPDQHQQMPNKDGCCPEKKDGAPKDDCCKGMADHKAGGGDDMATMKGHDMAGMKGHEMAGMKDHDMAGMTKQDHEKMMLACAKAPAKGATTPSAVQPTHKM